MTNAQRFIAAAKEGGIDAGLRAIGIDPASERTRRLRLVRMSDEARAIVDAVAQERGILASAIVARRSHRALVSARCEVMRRMRALGWSYPRIGMEMGKHHSSVMHCVGATKRGRAMVSKRVRAAMTKAVA